MSLAAEMLVPATVEDDLGAEARASTTFLRYELQLGYETPVGAAHTGRLNLLHEALTHITRGQARRRLPFPHSPGFRGAVVQGERRGGAFLSTGHNDTGTFVNVHGDGGSRGKPQPRAANRAGRSVLSTVTTNDHPTILAARREMQSWRRLALEPSSLRAPDDLNAPRHLASDGRHLASSLYRIAHEPDEQGRVEPDRVYARVANRLADLSGVAVRSLDVELDLKREVFTLYLDERGGLRLPARALSEGTLRFLVLCVMLEDSSLEGLICMEEPENGIHPANLPSIMSLVQDLSVDPSMSPDGDNPLRQVIVNTHSPGVVQLCQEDDLLLAESTPTSTPSGGRARALRLTPYRDTWRAGSGRSFTEVDVLPYLTSPVGAQMRLPIDLAG